MSPHADGPLRFNTSLADDGVTMDKMSKFGRSFSTVRIPYSFKLLMQELMVMNVNMKVITSANVDNLLTMNYSDNLGKLMRSDAGLGGLFANMRSDLLATQRAKQRDGVALLPAAIRVPAPVAERVLREARSDLEEDSASVSTFETPDMPPPPAHVLLQQQNRSSSSTFETPDMSPPPAHVLLQQQQNRSSSRSFGTPDMPPPTQLTEDDFLMTDPVSNPNIPDIPNLNTMPSSMASGEEVTSDDLDIKNPYIQGQFDALGAKDKLRLMHAVAQVEGETAQSQAQAQAQAPVQVQPQSIVINTPTVQMTQDTMGILKVAEPEPSSGDGNDDDGDAAADNSSSRNNTNAKSVSFD